MSLFYDGFSYLAPYWSSKKIENETVMFIGEEDKAKLMYLPKEILSVRNYGLTIVYEEGIDYKIENGYIKRLKGSKIPFMTIDDYFPKEAPSIPIGLKEDKTPYNIEKGRFLQYAEGDYFTKYEIAISYTHNDDWNGYVPRSKEDRFVSFFEKIEEGKQATLGIYGDSITTGCNSSGTPQGGNVSPFLESFPIMVKEYLEKEFDTKLHYFNTAVGGWQVKDAMAHLDERVIPFNADLLIIHLGINNGNLTVDQYYEEMKALCERIHEKNPKTLIMLLSSITCNPYSVWDGVQKEFYKAEQRLEDENDYITHAEMTPYFLDILKSGKKFADFAGNNINHPSDFIARAYAMVILKTMLGDDFYHFDELDN